MKIRDQLSKDHQQVCGRIDNWLDRYFPEFQTVFKNWSGKTALHTLRHFPLPSEVKAMSAEMLLSHWKEAVQRGVGIQKAEALLEAARTSIGVTEGLRMARWEMQELMNQYQSLQESLAELDAQIEGLLIGVPGAADMMAMKGINLLTVATFFAEVGDISQYKDPRQIQNLAGLTLKLHQSGTFRGQTKISKRGRKRLRKGLYLAVRPLVVFNPAFKALHAYYTTRNDHPLKKQESLIALCCKLIRVFFVMATKQCPFDGERMLQDMPQFSIQEAA